MILVGPLRYYRDRASVGAVGAAAPTLFSERLFCTHRNTLKQINIQEFHRKSIFCTHIFQSLMPPMNND